MNRRCASHIFRLSSLCDPRDAADLRSSIMVLGSRPRQSTGHSIGRREPELIPKGHRTGLHHRRMCNVDCRRSTFRRSAHILPPSAGQYTLILSLLIQTENYYSKFQPNFVIKVLLLSVSLTCHRRSGSLSRY